MATLHKQHPPPHTVNVITADDDELELLRKGIALVAYETAKLEMEAENKLAQKMMEDLG